MSKQKKRLNLKSFLWVSFAPSNDADEDFQPLEVESWLARTFSNSFSRTDRYDAIISIKSFWLIRDGCKFSLKCLVVFREKWSFWAPSTFFYLFEYFWDCFISFIPCTFTRNQVFRVRFSSRLFRCFKIFFFLQDVMIVPRKIWSTFL